MVRVATERHSPVCVLSAALRSSAPRLNIDRNHLLKFEVDEGRKLSPNRTL